MYFLTESDTMAVITSQGIYYKNKKYSCPLAISEQWFTLNSEYHLLKIPAIYSVEEEILYIILDNGELVSTFTLPNNIGLPLNELDNYFFKLNQLKQEIKSAQVFNKKKKG
jgi:hypothetical protein